MKLLKSTTNIFISGNILLQNGLDQQRLTSQKAKKKVLSLNCFSTLVEIMIKIKLIFYFTYTGQIKYFTKKKLI